MNWLWVTVLCTSYHQADGLALVHVTINPTRVTFGVR